MENKQTVYFLMDKMYSQLGGCIGGYLCVIKLHCET